MNWEEWTAVADNEEHWKTNEERGLLKAEYVNNYILRLWFEENRDVSIYELDFSPLLVENFPGEALLALREKTRFQQAVGNYALIWPDLQSGEYSQNTIDIAPECVRFFCEKYATLLKFPQKNISKKS